MNIDLDTIQLDQNSTNNTQNTNYTVLNNTNSANTTNTTIIADNKASRPGLQKNYYANNSLKSLGNDEKSKWNIWRFGRHCYGNIFFWLCSTGLCMLEPILVAREPVGFNLKLQKIILGISTFLWFLKLIGELDCYWKSDIQRHIKHKQGERWYNLTCAQQSFVYLFHRPEYVLDSFCLGCGWGTIYFRPGFAALRCYRVYSLLWYYRVDVLRDAAYDFFGPKYQSQVYRIIKVGKFAADALVAFGVDLFFLSSKTKGALMLIGIFFYSSYVLGACLWQETGYRLDACQTFTSCMFTLMRLTFYDGNGFDYLWELSKVWPLLFVLTVLYLCATAFGVLNGLIGIFASTFTAGSIMELDDGTYMEDYLKRPTKKPFPTPPCGNCGHCFQYMCGKLSCALCPLDDNEFVEDQRLLEGGAHFEEIAAAAAIESNKAKLAENEPSASARYYDYGEIIPDHFHSEKYQYTGQEKGFTGQTKDRLEQGKQRRRDVAASPDELEGKPRFAKRENLKDNSAIRNPFIMQTPDTVKAALDRQSREIHELKQTIILLAEQVAELNKRSSSSIIPDAINPFR